MMYGTIARLRLNPGMEDQLRAVADAERAVGIPRSELLGYLDYCRSRVRDTLAGMTDAQAATPLPQVHRFSGQPHAWLITSAVGHTIEHAAQIRQFITGARMAAEE